MDAAVDSPRRFPCELLEPLDSLAYGFGGMPWLRIAAEVMARMLAVVEELQRLLRCELLGSPELFGCGPA